MKHLIVVLLCFMVRAAPVRAIDGDTFVARIDGAAPKTERIRLRGAHTPELEGADRERALQAKEFTAAWLARGDVMLTICARDAHGRIVADVTRGESDLGKDLIDSGLARKTRR
jgi:endonuclease YncB( thermonuclease family)